MGPLSVCGCLLTVALAVRHWQVGIDVSESEVRLINWARVISIPWAEVERFGYDQGLWVRRRDMRQHYSAAFRPTAEALPFTHAAGVRAAQDLEALRKKRRRQGGGKDRR